MDKAELRKKAAAAIGGITPAELAAQSAAITRLVIDSPQFSGCATLFVYLSLAAEADTSAMLSAAFKVGKRVAAPRCRPNGAMDFIYLSSPDDTAAGLYGILEPRGERVARPLPHDLMLVPALLFTASGQRLGRGGGYYDRYLANHPSCFTMGLCLDCQLTDSLPAEPHDAALCAVATAHKIYY